MICRKCGSENDNGVRFCSRCGASFSDDKPPYSEEENHNPYGYDPFNNPFNKQDTAQNYDPFARDYVQPPLRYPVSSNYYDDGQVTLLQWLGLHAVNFIPVLGSLIFLILMIAFACGATEKKSLKTYAQATLIFMGICFVLALAVFMLALKTESYDLSSFY